METDRRKQGSADQSNEEKRRSASELAKTITAKSIYSSSRSSYSSTFATAGPFGASPLPASTSSAR